MLQPKLPLHVLFPLDRPLKWEQFRLRTLVHEVTDAMAARLLKRKIKTVIELGEQFSLRGDRDLLYQALLKLTQNAVDAMPAGGELTFSAQRRAGEVDVRVSDTGVGMTDEVRALAFQPYFTTKRHAAGLGLAVAQYIAQRHGGEAIALSGPLGGTVVTLRLGQQAAQSAA